MPSSNVDYWIGKVARNVERDIANRRRLLQLGWRVLTIWECALIGKWRKEQTKVIAMAADWLKSKISITKIEGEAADPTLDFFERWYHDPSY